MEDLTMLDRLDSSYDNIGGKIKNLAKLTFIVEAIGAIIMGLFFLINWGYEDGGWALFVIFFGPIVAWVSSWILYAFGELIEKTCDNESNTRMIVRLLKENDGQKMNKVRLTTYNGSSEQKATNTTINNKNQVDRSTQNARYTTTEEQKATNTTTNNKNQVDRSTQNARYTTTENNTIICSLCNFEQPANRKICWHCGAKFEEVNKTTISHQWLCNGCKKLRTQSPCEHCGKE